MRRLRIADVQYLLTISVQQMPHYQHQNDTITKNKVCVVVFVLNMLNVGFEPTHLRIGA